MHLIHLGFAVLPQLYPLDNLKALLMLQLHAAMAAYPLLGVMQNMTI